MRSVRSCVFLLAAVATVATTTAAAAADSLNLTTFYLSLSAVDPVLAFAPIGNRTASTTGSTDPNNMPTGAASVDPSVGWQISYSGTDVPPENVTFSTLGSGTPKRTTSVQGATVTVNWVGTGVWFYGNSSESGGVAVNVDGNPTLASQDAGVLGGIDNLPYRQHQAVLTVKAGTVNVYGATINTGRMAQISNSTAVTLQTISTVTGADKQLNAADWKATSTGGIAWAGRWDWAGTSWDHVGTTGQYATLAFPVPANTSFLVLYGGASGWNGDYNITFQPPLADEASGSRASEYSTWRGQDVVLWAGPLDPTVLYTMTLMTLLEDWWIDVSKVTLWPALDPNAASNSTNGTDASPDNKKSSPTGAIVGGVVGGVCALLALALLFFCLRRRKTKKRSPLDILDEPTPYTPFVRSDSQESSKFQTQSIGQLQTLGRAGADEGPSITPYSATSPTSAPSSSAADDVGTYSPMSSLAAAYKHQHASGGAVSPRREVTMQEEDAGDVLVNLVPPSYNPRWADSQGGGRSSGASGADGSGDGGGALADSSTRSEKA